MITFKELYASAQTLKNITKDDIDYLFKYYLKIEPWCLDEIVTKKVEKDYLKKIKNLQMGTPIQYVIGNVDFYGYQFNVRKGALIPRFETEELISKVKEYTKNNFNDKIDIIDIGTGSGVIGLTLEKEIINSNVTLVDISSRALKVANENAKNFSSKADIYKSDMLKQVIEGKQKFDVIVSNPPYLTYKEEIMDIVLKNEPSMALYGGKDGLKFYRIILKQAKEVIKDRALIAFEIGSNQGEAITKIAKQYFPNDIVKILKDLAGRERMFFLFHNIKDEIQL